MPCHGGTNNSLQSKDYNHVDLWTASQVARWDANEFDFDDLSDATLVEAVEVVDRSIVQKSEPLVVNDVGVASTSTHTPAPDVCPDIFNIRDTESELNSVMLTLNEIRRRHTSARTSSLVARTGAEISLDNDLAVLVGLVEKLKKACKDVFLASKVELDKLLVIQSIVNGLK